MRLRVAVQQLLNHRQRNIGLLGEGKVAAPFSQEAADSRVFWRGGKLVVTGTVVSLRQRKRTTTTNNFLRRSAVVDVDLNQLPLIIFETKLCKEAPRRSPTDNRLLAAVLYDHWH